MDTKECFAFIKDKFDRLFTIDLDNNSFTLNPGFGNIPPFTLVCVEGGEFMMGSNDSDREFPKHKVKVNSFFMAEFPVTLELYKGVTGKSPSNFQGFDHPVESVTWDDATDFCNQLNKLLALPKPYSGDGDAIQCNFDYIAFRLPTEAEWEFAAKGGVLSQPTTFAGSNYPDDVAWYRENNEYETKPVGLKFPNPLGLYDMSGNVWEWCWDRFNIYSKDSPIDNPKGSLSGSGRILRGGSWSAYADFGRVTSRYFKSQADHGLSIGFRILFAL